jgi:hypothetical protein
MRIRSFLVAAATAGAVIAGGLAGATAASAARTAAPPAPHADRLAVLSCRGPAFCMTVGTFSRPGQGTHRLVEVWNGKAWRVINDPIRGVPFFVTCGSPTFCLVGLSAAHKVELWNGKTWRIMRPQPPSFAFACGGARTCVAIHRSDLSRWNGTAWLPQPRADICAIAPHKRCGWDDIYCGSSTNCLAAGHLCASKACTSWPTEITMFWNGKTWTREPLPFVPGSLSCAGASFCMNTNFTDGAAVFDGHAWTDVSPDLSTACAGAPDCSLAGQLSCGAARSCMVGPSPAGMLSWNGTTWTFKKFALVNGKAPGLNTLSCGAANSCMFLGTYPGNSRRTIAEHWNGKSWQLSLTKNP